MRTLKAAPYTFNPLMPTDMEKRSISAPKLTTFSSYLKTNGGEFFYSLLKINSGIKGF